MERWWHQSFIEMGLICLHCYLWEGCQREKDYIKSSWTDNFAGPRICEIGIGFQDLIQPEWLKYNRITGINKQLGSCIRNGKFCSLSYIFNVPMFIFFFFSCPYLDPDFVLISGTVIWLWGGGRWFSYQSKMWTDHRIINCVTRCRDLHNSMENGSSELTRKERMIKSYPMKKYNFKVYSTVR